MTEARAPRSRITVLYVDQAVAFGGSLVVLARVVNNLDRDRYRAVIATAIEPEYLRRLLRVDCPIHRIPHNFSYRQLLVQRERINRVRIGVLRRAALYFLDLWQFVANVPYAVRIGALALRERVDVLHSNNGMDNTFACLVAIALRRALVVHLHGYASPGMVARLMGRAVTRFIAISRGIRDNVLTLGVEPDRVALIENGVELREPARGAGAEWRRQFGIGAEERTFGIVGRVMAWKGQKEFVRAAEIVLRRVPRARALVVGDVSDGPHDYMDEVRTLAERTGLGDRIVFTGYVEEMSAVYAGLDLVVHASIEPEPFGLVVIEAMAASKPVVVSDRGAPVDIVEHGVDGMIARPEESQKLAEAIVGLLQDDDRRVTMGARARRKVEERYSASAQAAAVSAVYDASVRR